MGTNAANCVAVIRVRNSLHRSIGIPRTANTTNSTLRYNSQKRRPNRPIIGPENCPGTGMISISRIQSECTYIRASHGEKHATTISVTSKYCLKKRRSHNENIPNPSSVNGTIDM